MEGKTNNKTNNKSFQLLNSIITKDDITPISKAKSSGKAVVTTTTSLIIDSIPSDIKSSTDIEGSDVESNASMHDSDILFSPLSNSLHIDDMYEEEMYDHKHFLLPQQASIISNTNNAANTTDESIVEDYRNVPAGLNIMDSHQYSLADDLPLSSPLSDTHDDFWKEVSTTDEEAICFGDDSTTEKDFFKQRKPSIIPQDTSMEDCISDELAATSMANNKEWNDKIFGDANYKVKLLCYRDAEGKLALKTRNVSTSNSRVMKKQVNASNKIYNNSKVNAATGMVGKKRKSKRSKLLKKAIRRKSGVAAMISTGVGIREFML